MVFSDCIYRKKGFYSLIKKAGCILLCAAVPVCQLLLPASALPEEAVVEQYLYSLFEARKAHEGVNGKLLSSEVFTSPEYGGSSAASSSYSDWIAFAMARFSIVKAEGDINFMYEEDYSSYLYALESYISRAYESGGGRLSSTKLTEWHRALLVIGALGGNPEQTGSYKGEPVNLVADSSYNSVIKPVRQGLNGSIFALISLNIKDFEIPESVLYEDSYFIEYILSRQLPDGGWNISAALTENPSADVDATAMAVQGLSAYYNDDRLFEITNSISGETAAVSVRQAVDRALDCLSAAQKSDGGFVSWGTQNVESVAQVIVALTQLGLDIRTDGRFIKNGSTLLDALLKYRLEDGSFTHSFSADAANPTAAAGKYNYMATDQAAYALVAYWRSIKGLNPLYDMRPDVDRQSLAREIIAKLQELLKSFTAALQGFIEKIFLLVNGELRPVEIRTGILR